MCIQGGHSSGKPGKVRELKSGQEKSGKMNYYNYLVAAIITLWISYTFLYKPILSHWSISDNVVVIDMSVYMSVAARNECICLYRYC